MEARLHFYRLQVWAAAGESRWVVGGIVNLLAVCVNAIASSSTLTNRSSLLYYGNSLGTIEL